MNSMNFKDFPFRTHMAISFRLTKLTLNNSLTNHHPLRHKHKQTLCFVSSFFYVTVGGDRKGMLGLVKCPSCMVVCM